MGTIKCGFWKMRFIISPSEFGEFLDRCEHFGISFHCRCYGYPLHSKDKMTELYKAFYDGIISPSKPPRGSHIAHGMDFSSDKKKIIGFNLTEDDYIYYHHYGELAHGGWGKDRLRCLEITYQKSVAVNIDEKHFVYEDILLHEPEGYPIFAALIEPVKKITKPLRFDAWWDEGQSYEEKPNVRISLQAARDLSQSWIFKTYNLTMKSYKLNAG